MKFIILALAISSLAGCATITRGTSDDVVIDVEPKNATVTTSLGLTCEAQPCTIKASRKKGFTVTAKAEGYEDASVEVTTGVSKGGTAGLAGNVLVGGLVGLGIDAATGASKSHSPNPVVIRMVPVTSREDKKNKTAPTS